MRIISIIISVLVASMAYAQNSQPVPVEITVNGDTTIYVRDALNLPDSIFLYGEKFNGIQYGGDKESLFEQHQVKHNDFDGIDVGRDTIKGIYIKVTADELGYSEDLTFKYAYEKAEDDWYPNDTSKIQIKIIKNMSSASNPIASEPISDEVEDSDSDPIKENTSHIEIFLWLLAVIMVASWFVGYKLVVRFVTKKVDKQIKAYNDRKEDNSIYYPDTSNHNNSESHNEFPQPIKKFIEDTIKNELSKQKRKRDESIDSSHIKVSPKPILPSNPNPKSLDTDDVVYDIDNKTFKVEKTELKIFRLFSQNSEYFYTVVDDSNIREEFFSMLTTYEGCIEWEQISHNPTRVEPEKPGKLIKEGEIYRVDPNHKLKIRLI